MTTVSNEVKRGMHFLDNRKKEWWNTVDLDCLNMRSVYKDILGQVFHFSPMETSGSPKWEQYEGVIKSLTGLDNYERCLYGFAGDSEKLANEWHAAIMQRREENPEIVTIREKVANGIRLLDFHEVAWKQEATSNDFDMSNAISSILPKCYGSMNRAITELKYQNDHNEELWLIEKGFIAKDEDDTTLLTQEWKRAATLTLLTPAQFIAARALADKFGHMWAGVPDETYAIEDIEEYFDGDNNPGIQSPGYRMETIGAHAYPIVEHRTGHNGRYSWEVHAGGNTCIRIHRPIGVASPYEVTRDNLNEDDGIIVAQFWLINDNDELFAPDDYCYLVSNDFQHLASQNAAIQIDTDTHVYTKYLHTYHLDDLLRPIVALLAVALPPKKKSEEYTEWNKQYLSPLYDKVRSWLKPLYDIALPNPLRPCLMTYNYETGEETPYQYPETYWSRPTEEWNDESTTPMVYHRGESFPVESEWRAIHTVLLLQEHPEMSLLEAVRASLLAHTVRPKA